MNPPRPVLDLNVVPTEEEEPMEIDPPAAPVPPRPQAPKLGTTNTVQRLFREFTLRRTALISAITTDEEELVRKCEPGLDPMYLYGHTDGSWEVLKPELPPSQAEPVLSINTLRDNMERVQWLQQIAKHCDIWLINVSLFAGAQLLNADGRELLLNSMNSLPTVHEEFINSEAYHRLCCEKKAKSKAADNEVEDLDDQMVDYKDLKNKDDKKDFDNENDSKEAEEDDATICNFCSGDIYHKNAFWIGCDACKGRFLGKCVMITEDQAKHVKRFVCPDCRFDENGHDDDSGP